MKRKLLLAFAISALLMLVFAISIFATEIPEWTEITEVSGMPDKSVFGTDGTKGATSRVLMSDGITYPAYYICKDSATLGFSFTDLNNKTAGGYSAEKVVRIEIPRGTVKSPMSAMKTENGFTALKTASFPEGFKTMGGYTFKATETIPSALLYVSFPSTLESFGINEFILCTELRELVIPEGITEIPESFAKQTTSLKTLVLPSTIQEIDKYAFRSSNLSDGVVIPEGCTSIGEYAFAGSNITSVVVPSTITTIGGSVFSDCATLKEVYCNATFVQNNMFKNCAEIDTLVLKNTKTIGEHAFNVPSGQSSKITTLVLPEGLTKINSYAFARCGAKNLILPSTLTEFGTEIFKGSTNLEKVTILGSVTATDMFLGCTSFKVLVITENYITFGEKTMVNAKNDFITFYTGTDYDRIRTLITSSRVQNAKNCTYDDYVKGNYTSNNLLVYGANLCEVSYDSNHTESELQNYQTKCTRCGLAVYCENPEHNQDITISYESFSKAGVKIVKCIECATAGRRVEAEPLYVSLGYSLSEDGGVTTGFRVNYDAISEYEKATGENLNYGLFVAVYDRIGNSDIIDLETGKTNENAIAFEISNRQFSILNIKMTGFETTEQKSASFSFGMFVVATKDETKKLVYLQHDAPVDESKYSYITYNSLLG